MGYFDGMWTVGICTELHYIYTHTHTHSPIPTLVGRNYVYFLATKVAAYPYEYQALGFETVLIGPDFLVVCGIANKWNWTEGN